MKDCESSGAAKVLTGCDTNDELLMITDEKCNREVMKNSSDEGSTSLWILDSSCSFHVCSNRKGFDTYEEMKGSKISLGNKTSCDVLGVGTVKIKMHDGLIRSLSKVRRIPELRRNLISLDDLDKEGHSYKDK